MRLLIVTALLSVALVAACGSESKFDPTKYAGTYEGNWLSGGATGPATLTIVVDEAKKTADITIDLGGNYLGLGDPAPKTLNGTYDHKQATSKGTDALFGTYDIVIDAKGKVTGSMDRLAGGTIPKLTFTGKLTGERLEVNYVVTMPIGGDIKSTATMAKKK